jgi:putative ABC transport system permease protein
LRTAQEGKTPSVAWPDFVDWRDQARGFETMSVYAEAEGTFAWDDSAEQLSGALVTRDFFDLMGVPLALGRSFSADEDMAGGPSALVVSHGFWKSRLGGASDVLGRTVPMDGELVPIVGVAAEGFTTPYDETWFWQPMAGDQLLASVGLPTGTRTLNFQSVIGRLGPGVDLRAAESDLRALALRIDESVGKEEGQRSNVALVPLSEWVVGDIDTTLFFLLSAAGLVLLVAAANVAGLAFSRAAVRERELAVRTAMGAGRGRLIRQLLTESGVVAVLAGTAGAALAWLMLGSLLQLAPPGLPRSANVGMSTTALVFALGATAFSGFVFGALPAWRASRIDLATGLSGGRGSSGSRRALLPQQVLVTFQVALSVVLLTGATLLVGSFAKLTGVDTGFDAESVVVATIAPPEARYQTAAELNTFYEDLLTRVRSLPGVSHATTTYSAPLFGTYFSTTVVPEGTEEDDANQRWVGTVIIRDGYFETNSVPLLKGRDFAPSDRLGEPLVVIVNQTLADDLWPDGSVIGRRMQYTGGLMGSADSFDPEFFPDSWMTVVGVAGDVRRESLSDVPKPEYYRPHSQITWGFQYLMVRADSDPSAVASLIREAVWSIDSSVPVREVRTMDAQVAESVAIPRFRMILLAAFAGITCLLSMVGLYALLALAVTRRTREMGIRLALGARRSEVMRGVLARGLRLVFYGTLLGVGAAFLSSRALSSMLFEVESTDPATYAAVVLLIASVAVVACYLPARRAGRVDPVVSLQEE